jgi:hypothetical protein
MDHLKHLISKVNWVNFEINSVLPSLLLDFVEEVLTCLFTPPLGNFQLITCELAVNALSHEGCGHFEVFDRSDEDFERGIFQVEDPVLKRSVGHFMIGCGALTVVILSGRGQTG